MLIKGAGKGDFEMAPEGDGIAVCVDVTPLKKRETKFGTKEEFKFVFELDPSKFGTRKDGSPYCIWSRGFTPFLSLKPKKSNLTKFLEGWLGRQFTEADMRAGIDAEKLIGKCAKVIIEHEDVGENTYANILSIRPTKVDIEPSGGFVREQDRENKKANAAAKTAENAEEAESAEEDSDASAKGSFHGAEKPAGAGRDDWQKVKIHVGRNKGVDLGDLDPEGADFQALFTKWLPKVKEAPRMSADDKRLAAALEQAVKEYEDLKKQIESESADADADAQIEGDF